jgi:hypothetical protein
MQQKYPDADGRLMTFITGFSDNFYRFWKFSMEKTTGLSDSREIKMEW